MLRARASKLLAQGGTRCPPAHVPRHRLHALGHDPTSNALRQQRGWAGSFRERQSSRRHGALATGGTPTGNAATKPASQEETKVQAVVFDLDGVLCRTQELSASVVFRVLQEQAGLQVQPSDLAPFRGSGEAALLAGAAASLGKELDVDRAVDRFLELFRQECAAAGSAMAYPGAVQLVQSCRTAGLKVAVASSAAGTKVEACLSASGFSATDFDAVITADEVACLKPAPDAFLAAARQLQLRPEACVVVEDSVVGLQAATAAGMRSVAVATSGMPDDQLRAGGAALVRKDIAAILLDDITGQPATVTPAVPAGAAENLGWLEQTVQLPAGYRTTRRELLKLLPLAVGSGCLYVAATRAQAMSMASPKAVLEALFPSATPPQPEEGSDRVDAFVRYIADLERRGGGEEVPEFPKGLDWLNAPPLRLSKELSGKVVVLDFWTYCCINCMHVLPDLAAVEAAFEGRPVSVVGVHSAKFDNEKDSEAIRNAVLRYDVVHPVVNDGNMTMWGALGVNSWPTLVVVSPRGRVIARLAGEGHRQDLQDFVAAAFKYYGPLGLLDETPVPQALEKDKEGSTQAPSGLRYPGKIAVDAQGARLFITDSNNHRIVITDLEGKYQAQIGGNGPGFRDGSWQEAAFNRPQGVAYSRLGDCLYVADTENHALRRVQLGASGGVETLAGNGVKGSDYKGGRSGGAQQLNSPWDVVMDAQEENVLVAMAGQHQIWQYNVGSATCYNLSGTGYERNQNGPTPYTTSWAQPSGLSLSSSGNEVYVADSESSAVRVLDLSTLTSRSLAGGDPLFSDNLFRFGDADGFGSKALLQHPLAVCCAPDGKVYVADSYNHKLKVLDPATGEIATLAGDGRPGLKDGPLGPSGGTRLSEPGGLTWGSDGKLYVADTNNGAVRVVDLKAGKLVMLRLTGVPAPSVDPNSVDIRGQQAVVPPGAKVVRANPTPSTQGKITIQLDLPPGYHLTTGANSSFTAAAVQLSGSPAPVPIIVTPSQGPLPESTRFEVTFQPAATGAAGAGSTVDVAVRVLAKVYFCKDDDACLYEQVCFLVPLGGGGGGGPAQVTLQYRLDPSAPVVTAF